ncbi:unnamed protein product [Prunus armeniaca]
MVLGCGSDHAMGLRQTAGKALLILGILLMWVGLGIMVGHWIFSSMGPFSLLSHANPCVWVPGTGSSSRAPSGLKLTFLEPSMGLVIARSPPCHNLLSKPRGDSAEFLVGVKLVILLNFCMGWQLGHLCLTAARCLTRTGFGSSFKVEFGLGHIRND